MSVKNGYIQSLSGDEQSARQNRMDLWNESIRRAAQARTTSQQVAKDQNEARANMEQKIRNGQMPCPTCANRTYKDESNDSGVSFQAPKHLSAATAGTAVINHEWEHVSSEDAKARETGGHARSTVMLEKGICETCGRTYIKGGVTKSTKSSPQKLPWNGFEAEA